MRFLQETNHWITSALSFHRRAFFLSDSVLPPDLIRAYQETEYRAYAEPPFTLRIGQLSPELAQEYETRKASCCAFLTACNPFSQKLKPEQNAERQEALAKALKSRGLNFLEGLGQHPSNGWEGEPSYLVFDLSLEAAKAMGRSFEQNAVVWVGPEGLPELIVLR